MPHTTRRASITGVERTGRPRLGLWALTLVSMLLFALLPVSTAQAATANNGYCERDEVCFFYNSYLSGSMRDFSSRTLGTYFSSTGVCYTFNSDGLGKGKCVKNNAASVWNRTTGTVTVYYNSYYSGTYQQFESGASGNLNPTMKNNNASHYGDAPPYAAPVFTTRETEAGWKHHAARTFRAYNVYDGLHVRRVWVRLVRECAVWDDGDTGRVYSAYAKSPSDTTTYSVETSLYDGPWPGSACTVRSSYGTEYFPR